MKHGGTLMVPNDEVERRALMVSEGTILRSFDPSRPHRTCDTLLQPIVRRKT